MQLKEVTLFDHLYFSPDGRIYMEVALSLKDSGSWLHLERKKDQSTRFGSVRGWIKKRKKKEGGAQNWGCGCLEKKKINKIKEASWILKQELTGCSRFQNKRLGTGKYLEQFSLNLTAKCYRNCLLELLEGVWGKMRGLLLWIYLTEGKCGVFYWEGAAWVCVPPRGRCCGHGACEMEREVGDVDHLAHLRWIARELPRSSLKTLFCGVGGEAKQPSKLSSLHWKSLSWEIPLGSSAFS